MIEDWIWGCWWWVLLKEWDSLFLLDKIFFFGDGLILEIVEMVGDMKFLEVFGVLIIVFEIWFFLFLDLGFWVSFLGNGLVWKFCCIRFFVLEFFGLGFGWDGIEGEEEFMIDGWNF